MAQSVRELAVLAERSVVPIPEYLILLALLGMKYLHSAHAYMHTFKHM